MGDILSQKLPNSGRIILSQISSGSTVPLAAILLLGLPNDPSTAFMHGLVFSIMGFCKSWIAPATNNPIFAEIVPQKHRTTVYALDRSFESIMASFAPATVGLLAQHVYGYKPIHKGSSDSATVEVDRENAAALAKGLYTAIGIPIGVCCLIYSFLYYTYPRDRERARMQALIESEIQLVDKCGESTPGQEQMIVGFWEVDGEEPGMKDRTEIDMEDDGENEENMELGKSDERTLLLGQLMLSDSRK
ncbi:hypothetical protein Ancab_026332 [Ancistrocladus abbreviatus]